MPAGAIPLALLSFNLGIEVGQLLFVLVVLVLRRAMRPVVAPPSAGRVAVYRMSSLAGYWALERAIDLMR